MKLIKISVLFSLFALLSCNMSASDSKKSADEKGKEKKSEIKVLTLKDFKDLVYDYEANPDKWTYKGSVPAIIDFYADWCGPCRMIAPTLKELSEEYAGKLVVYKIDIEKERELAALFQVSSIPMLLFIPMDGTPRITRGAMGKADFVKAIDSYLFSTEKAASK